MSIFLRACLTALALLAFSGTAMAGDDHGHRRHGHHHHGHKHHGHKHHYHHSYSHHDNHYYSHRYHRPHWGASISLLPPVRTYVQPTPVYVAPPVQVIQQQPAPYCRESSTIVNVGGSFRRVYGTACYQPDGSWQMVDGR
ncbi:MAG: hypothetical protein J0L97_09350 [Alphaproteobacteria bacterium]|nr:hypothetical protein [Alphaproteobacteria bacterium]